MFWGELEELGKVPANGVLCLLCRQKILVTDGDISTLREHLTESHSVFNNLDWLINCTIHSQKRTGLVRRVQDSSDDEPVRRKRGRKITNKDTGKGKKRSYDWEEEEENVSSEDEPRPRRRAQRRNYKEEQEGPSKKFKSSHLDEEDEILEDKEELSDPLESFKIKGCDVRIENEDFSAYFKDIEIEASQESTLVDPSKSSEEHEEEDNNNRETSDGSETIDYQGEAQRKGQDECEAFEPGKGDSVAQKKLELEEPTVSNVELKKLEVPVKVIEKEMEPKELEKETKKVEAEEPEEVEDESSWYAGNTFTCVECNYQSKVSRSFEEHVKSQHNVSLRQFSGRYKVTNLKYSCKICEGKVKHDKRSIESHVQSHFLSLAKYGQLYERKKVREKVSPPATTEQVIDINTEQGTKDPALNQTEPLRDTNKPESPPVESAQETPEFCTAEDQLSFTIAEVNEVIHSLLSEEANTGRAPSPAPEKPSDEVYLYCCPFPGCQYTCNFQQVKQGPAASHCIQEHDTQPWQFKMKGLKWRRVTLMSQMEKIFDE